MSNLPVLETKEIRFRFTRQVFVVHPLTPVDGDVDVLKLWEKEIEEKKRRRQPIARVHFYRWLREETKVRKQLSKIRSEALNDDLAFARMWYWVCSKHPFERIEEHLRFEFGSIERRIAEECLEWIWSAERSALLHFYLGQYRSGANEKAEFVTECTKLSSNERVKRAIASVAEPHLIRTQIHGLIDSRQGKMFSIEMLNLPKPVTSSSLRVDLFAQINAFQNDIDKKVLPQFALSRRYKRSLDIVLTHECTKAAYAAIQAYLIALDNYQNTIEVDGNLDDKGITFPIERVKFDLKAPILEASHQERVRFASEDIDEWATVCAETIDELLNVGAIQRRSEVAPFIMLIEDDMIAEDAHEMNLMDRVSQARDLLLKLPRCPETIISGIFCIHMSNVWEVATRRAKLMIKNCSTRLKEQFKRSVLELAEIFSNFSKLLFFRSLDPVSMLTNKGQVQRLWDEGQVSNAIDRLVALFDRMHYLSEVISLDAEEHELVTKVASMRKALPRQLADYGFFFKKRLPLFIQFVKSRQKVLLAKVGESVEHLKLLQTFTNPADVDEYMEHMRSIVPIVQQLCAEVDSLNAFERVVDMPQTEVLRIRALMKDVTAMSNLFASTQRFQQYQQEFFSRRRIDADVEGSRKLLDEHIEEISSLEGLLGTQKAAKHFILQARNEADKFKKNFAVLEVMACPRFMERHWLRMSEIVGYDLSRYKEASVAQMCELGLDVFINQLKPIAYNAEREGVASDQLTAISTFWQEAVFAMKVSSFWNIALPENLGSLIAIADANLRTLRASKEPEDAIFTVSSDKTVNWTEQLDLILSILTDWHKSLTHWKRLASVMRYSSARMPQEFTEFRTCAKYWKKFEERLKVDPLVINIRGWKHVRCWLRIIDEHMGKMINGVRCYLDLLRRSSARMCFLSDGDLLKLLSDTEITKSIRILKRECFPGLRDICEQRDGVLALSNFDGETLMIPFELERMRRAGPFDFVNQLEHDIDKKLCEELFVLMSEAGESSLRSSKLMHDMGTSAPHKSKLILEAGRSVSHIPKLISSLHSYVRRADTNSPFEYIVQNGKVFMVLKESRKPILLKLAFISVEPMRVLSMEFAHQWSLGKFPLLVGNLRDCRLFVRNFSQTLFTTVHYVNCSRRLRKSVISAALKASQQETIVIALENVNQLSEDAVQVLLEELASIKPKSFPRLVMYSTIEEQHLVTSLAVFVVRDIGRPESAKTTAPMAINPPLLEVNGVGLAVGNRRFSTRRRESSLRERTPSEMVFDAANTGGCAFVGSSAKRTLIEGIEFNQANAKWIYLDAFTVDQLISEPAEFGTSIMGYLPSSLKETIKTDSRSSHATLTPMTASTSDSRRVGSISLPQRYIIFYTHQQFALHFPMLSALFCANEHSDSPPPYITLPDGSNFYAACNMHFALCLPAKQMEQLKWIERNGIRMLTFDDIRSQSANQKWDQWRRRFEELLVEEDFIEMMTNTMEMIILPLFEAFNEISEDLDIIFEIMLQDLKEIRPNIFAVNYGELIRWASCSACCNWLAVFIDKPDQLDYLVTELAAEADKNVSNAGKLPDQISSWKLSALDFSRWVRWMDEPNVVSCLEKDLCVSDIVVIYPDFDRVITYLQRLFANSNNILLYGPDCCGKTTLIKRFVKHITSLDDRYHFVWLQSADRFDVLKMQNHFASILRTKCDGKLVLIIDNFHFVEAILSLLEMYCEHNLFIDNGSPQFTDTKLQIILIMRENEYEALSINGILIDKFRLIRMQSPSTENLQIIFEQIVLWHLHTKAFNAEYQTLLGSMSSATLRVIQLPAVQMPHLILAQRIAKGMMFAFPDSTPDLDGMIRLWTHETMRCVADSLTSCRHVRRLIEVLERCLKEVFSLGDRSFSKVISAQSGEKSEDITVEGTVEEQRSVLKKLIFSEIIAPDGIEGIPYTCVANFDLYQR